MASNGGVRKGLTPYRKKAGGYFSGGVDRFLVSNGYATALGIGDPVKVSNGFIQVAAHTSGGVTGVFMGCRYIDANLGVVDSTYFPANTSSAGRLEDQAHVIGYVAMGTDLTFLAIADASVSANQVGNTVAVSVGTPSAITKRSNLRVKPAVQTSADVHMVRVLGFPNLGGTLADAATTVVEVELVGPALTSG